MIDTIAINLTSKEYRIADNLKLNSSLYVGKSHYSKAVYNPNIKIEGYKPRLTFLNYGLPILRIEFSAPKMLYGNNFDELENKDFEPLIQKLTSDLRSMGIEVYQWNLRNAQVAKIDYSKNIILTDGTKSSMILHELSKADINRKIDIAETKYRIGHSLQFHTNCYEYVFYDKVADLKQAKISEKRAIENNSIVQLNLLDLIKEDPFEVFRIEIRLDKRKKIKETLNKLGLPEEMTFQALFKQELSKPILNHCWNHTIDCLNLAMINDSDLACVLSKILDTGRFKLSRALAITSALKIIHLEGERKFEKLVEPYIHNRTYGSLKSDMLSLNLPKHTKLKTLLNVGKILDRFNKVRLKDYPQLSQN